MKRLQHVRCTIHDLEFGYDDDRVRALKQEPALMRCPVCTRKDISDLVRQIEQVKAHRDLLISAIDLAKLHQPVS